MRGPRGPGERNYLLAVLVVRSHRRSRPTMIYLFGFKRALTILWILAIELDYRLGWPASTVWLAQDSRRHRACLSHTLWRVEETRYRNKEEQYLGRIQVVS